MFTGVYIIFLISAQNIRKKYQNFLSENIHFFVIKFSVCLNRHVFVMSTFSTFPEYNVFCYLLLDFHFKTGTRFSLRDKRLFEISRAEITRVDCMNIIQHKCMHVYIITHLLRTYIPMCDKCKCQT